MIVPFRNGRAKVLRYASFRRIADLVNEWRECDFVVLAASTEQFDAMRATHQNDAKKVSESPCIASRSRAGVLAERTST